VPGALLSFVCFNALNIASSSSPKLNPAEILNKAREVVINTFEKSQETVNDGMDIALCVLNRKTNVLNFAGANSPLFVIKNIDREIQETDVCNESHFIEVTKGDSQPIGNYYNLKPFTNHSLQLSEGDIITVFSDGYPDQFGGKRNKKFGYKRFKNTLLSIHDKPIIEQKKILNNKFMEWKGEYEQIDDVLVLQIRV
jgi:serine phosphatase RsbU (regulator of sigma subunit)